MLWYKEKVQRQVPRRITRDLDAPGFIPSLEFCYELMNVSQLIHPPERPSPLGGSKFAVTSVSLQELILNLNSVIWVCVPDSGGHQTASFRGSGSHLWNSPVHGLALRAVTLWWWPHFSFLLLLFSWFAWEAGTKDVEPPFIMYSPELWHSTNEFSHFIICTCWILW